MIAKLPIKWRITLPIIISIFAIFASISTYNYFVVKGALEDEVKNGLLEVSKRASHQVMTFINIPMTSVHSLAQAALQMRLAPDRSRERLSDFAKGVLKNHPESVGIWISSDPDTFDNISDRYKKSKYGDSSGRLNIWWTQSNGKLNQENPSEYSEEKDEDYFKLSKVTGKDQIIEPYIDEVGGKKIMMTSVTSGVFLNGKYLATAGLDLALVEVQKMISQINPYEGTQAYLISDGLKYVSHPDKTMLGKDIDATINSTYKLSERFKSGSDFFVEMKDHLAVFHPVSFKGVEGKWFIEIKVPYSSIFAVVNRSLFVQVATAFIAIALIAFVVFMITSQIASSLYRSSDNLSKSADIIDSTANNLNKTSQELSSATSEQAASVEETTASLEEISGMVENNVTNAEEAFNLAEMVKKSSEKGEQSMILLKEAMSDIKKSNQRIEALVSVIENIGEKTAVMDEIVFQTKLLSFNASVEAERAGEHGRGFAVVAQEVGNLASLTGKSASDISTIVKESIEEARHVTLENNEKVKLGDQYANEMSEHLLSIKEASKSVSVSSRQVLDASKEQSIGIAQINTAMGQVDKANQINSSMADETATYSDKLDTETDNLKRVVSDIKVLIQGS